MDISHFLWDTRLSGNARARLTPWLYQEHRDAYNAAIAMMKVTNPELAKEVEAVYEELEAFNAPKTETVVVEPTEEKPKKGRKKKSA